jgi:hypothetical protein
MKRGCGTLLMVIVPLLVISACSSTTPNPSVNPAPMGVCGLVPNMDELVGQTAVDRPAGFTLNDVDRCTWTYQLDPSRSVGISLAPLVAHDAAIESFGEGEQVAGLGQDARWWASNNLLSVLVEGGTLQVDLQLDEEHVSKELAVSIAQAALQNLN